ncbi:putative amidohydrolase ytcJ [Glarea lozoyensis 74030]|uniref:Putative amidohydrolase ytcJ n=1 Tax=Glarea lozoyensis (strain ATCC 74030 / MF5533) TaxID=1104152 RepID=H0EV77_GLAL7|nr:putative amidohydrolase ytcJ [Glarea lozoyensis 74030]
MAQYAEVPTTSEESITYLDGWTIPGIIESHGHHLQYGEMLESVLLYDAKSMKEVRGRIGEFLERHRGEGYGTRGKWIRGIGWDQKYFGGVMPTAADLAVDPLLSDLYMMLDRVDVHCVLTSQKVLDLLPNPLPAAPPGGFIITDPGPGVFCDNAMDAIINPIAPKPDVAQKTRWFKTAMAELNKVGVTGAGDAGMRPQDIMILEDMAVKGELSMRLNVMIECPERNTYCPLDLTDLKLLEAPRGMGENKLILGGVKIFADGALGSRGAALLEPYSDMPDTRGVMLINETALKAVVADWANAGFQVNVHAIGDRANRAAIDAFEMLGSDFPVEPPNPFHGMYAAVTRLSPATLDSPSGKGGWYPEEKLSVEQALRGFTSNGAYGWFKENEMGTIEVGKYADWVVVDRDILADKSGMSLVDVEVRETWVGGAKVYSSNAPEVEVTGGKGWRSVLSEWAAWSRDVINGQMWWMRTS